jgi:SAM-dependent methyltransferase
MSEYKTASYGEHIAEVYDDWYSGQDTEGAVEFLCGLAKGENALELGIGTGRVALPLSARGAKVHGIDASPAMVDKMRKKPGGENIAVTLGDFADVPVSRPLRSDLCSVQHLLLTADTGGAGQMFPGLRPTSREKRGFCFREFRTGSDPD